MLRIDHGQLINRLWDKCEVIGEGNGGNRQALEQNRRFEGIEGSQAEVSANFSGQLVRFAFEAATEGHRA